MNMVSLRIESTNQFVRVFPVNEGMARKAQSTEDRYHCHARYLVLTRPEACYAIACLEGVATFYPWIDDGTHLIRFAQNGFREVYLNGSKWEDFCFTMPGSYLASLLKLALREAPKNQGDDPYWI